MTDDPREVSRGGLAADRSVGLFIAAMRLTGALVVIVLAFAALAGPPPDEVWSVWYVLERVTNVLAQLLPFGAFAAGLAGAGLRSPDRLRRRALLRSAAALGMLTYLFFAVASPLAENARDAQAGADVQQLRPFGPATPGGLLRQRAFLEANPPETYSFSVDRPLDRPVNWVDYRLHVPVAYSAFALINALIGFWVGLLTVHMAAVRRRLARWAIGLFGGVGFLAVWLASNVWLRTSPTSSGALVAWVPLAVPLLELLVVYVLARGSRHYLHGDEPGRV